MKQPKNILAPWGVVTDSGGYVGIDETGLISEVVKVVKLQFEDGSAMTTAGVSSAVDGGTF